LLLGNSQLEGVVKLGEDATSTLAKCGKGAILFFGLPGVSQLQVSVANTLSHVFLQLAEPSAFYQACAKLLSCDEVQRTVSVGWLACSSMSHVINQSVWSCKTRAVCAGLQVRAVSFVFWFSDKKRIFRELNFTVMCVFHISLLSISLGVKLESESISIV